MASVQSTGLTPPNRRVPIRLGKASQGRLANPLQLASDAMDPRTQAQMERLSIQFAKILGKLVNLTYCLGAADENEIRAAHIHYLLTIADNLRSEMTANVQVPLKRYE